jgi:hypothetical protein
LSYLWHMLKTYFLIGKFFERSYQIKSTPCGIALRRNGKIQHKRPAAGFFLYYYITDCSKDGAEIAVARDFSLSYTEENEKIRGVYVDDGKTIL